MDVSFLLIITTGMLLGGTFFIRIITRPGSQDIRSAPEILSQKIEQRTGIDSTMDNIVRDHVNDNMVTGIHYLGYNPSYFAAISLFSFMSYPYLTHRYRMYRRMGPSIINNPYFRLYDKFFHKAIKWIFK